MKKLNYYLAVICMVGSLACSKGGDSEPEPNPTVNNGNNSGGDENPDEMESLSYQADIRPIFSGNCISCHGNPPTQDAPMSLTTLAFIREAVDNRGLLSRINNTADPMPPTGLLPQSTRQLIADWVDQGYPE